MTTPACRRIGQEYALAAAAQAAAAGPGTLQARIIPPQQNSLAVLGLDSQEARGFAVAAALRAAGNDPAPAVQHAAGLASLITGDPTEATEYLTVAAHRSDDVRSWVHLAAAHYERAVREKKAHHLLSSLGASSHALTIDEHQPAAAYNFALAVEQLGVSPAAIELWTRYLAYSDDERWKHEARRRVSALTARPPANEAWMTFIRSHRNDSPSLAEATERYPQQARMWAEGEGLTLWAEAVLRRDGQTATVLLNQARTIGRMLRRVTGESLLHDAVAAIDDAHRADDEQRIQMLADGHRQYRRARQLYRDGRIQQAHRALLDARQRFGTAGSPLDLLAAAYAASTLHDADRFAEAHAEIRLLLDAIPANAGYYALRAQVLYQLARLNGIQGMWNDAFAASTEAAAVYHRIGERGNEGATALLIAEAYDFIGQPAAAIQHGTAAIALLAETGDAYRLRVSAAVLCRSFMRRRLWDAAQSFVRIERALDRLSSDPIVTTDVLIRAAIIEQHLGRPLIADRTLQTAALEAARLPDEGLRASLATDVRAAQGVLARRRDAGLSVAKLSEAIDYMERADRVIQLPHLYLERGRAQLARSRLREALSDFERGISHLEHQRSQLVGSGMRYGIFDDAHELFTEAIALHLHFRDAEAAFTVVERGRARALLEQIAAEPRPAAPLSLGDVGRRMPTGTLLLEYATLPDRVLLFVTARDFRAVREVRVSAEAFTAKIEMFVDALAARRPWSEIRDLATELHDICVGSIPERSRYERLAFVPDAVLQQMPFGALFDRTKNEFLIEQHLFVTAPSAAVFLESRARYSASPHQSINAGVFIGARGTNTIPLKPLPELEREAGAIAATYRRSTLWRNPEMSVDRFLSEAPKYDVVHFGGHALIDPIDPSHSSLVLTPRDASDSGLLDCRRIGMSKLRKPRLLVLAACSTLRGRTGRVEGTPSIARSFLAAGVPTVVGTLWDIDDAETSTLVTDFHREVAAGSIPAIALRNAQLRSLRGTYPAASHPGSWAAFAILGSGGV